MPFDLFAILTFSFLVKLGLLIIVGLYTIFALFLIVQVRSLNNTLHIESNHASAIMVLLTLIHFFASLSLFILILAIL